MVTETLDWKLHGADLVSDHSLPVRMQPPTHTVHPSRHLVSCARLVCPMPPCASAQMYSDPKHPCNPIHVPMQADHCLVHTSWMVGNQYKPAELGKAEWDIIRDSPTWAVDAWGLGCLIQARLCLCLCIRPPAVGKVVSLRNLRDPFGLASHQEWTRRKM